METVNLPAAALRPNGYNPNTMTKDELAELVAELHHLARLPKPIVVRPQEEGVWQIVDGEHNWRAALVAGYAEVPCEVIAADDFEAMRQTYKRNRHGTENAVALGRMFGAMLAARGLSQRGLAEAIGVSEGTVRNALLYAQAADLRNDYAFEALTVRQIRNYLALPETLRDGWIDAGATDDHHRELLRLQEMERAAAWELQRRQQQAREREKERADKPAASALANAILAHEDIFQAWKEGVPRDWTEVPDDFKARLIATLKETEIGIALAQPEVIAQIDPERDLGIPGSLVEAWGEPPDLFILAAVVQRCAVDLAESVRKGYSTLDAAYEKLRERYPDWLPAWPWSWAPGSLAGPASLRCAACGERRPGREVAKVFAKGTLTLWCEACCQKALAVGTAQYWPGDSAADEAASIHGERPTVT